MASSIVKSAAQQLGSLLVEETKSLYHVRDKIDSLRKELEWMEEFLRDADTQQHKDSVLRLWVSDVQDLAYDAEDIIERYIHEVPRHRQDGIRNTLKWFSCILWTCNVGTLHNLGSEIDELTVKMSELTKRSKRYGIQIIRQPRSLEYNSDIREERRTYSYIDEDVVGLKEDIDKVVHQLLKTEVKVVAISGIGGLGKTTLARKVFKHKDIKDHFLDNCAWVYISKEFDKINIFEEILHQLEKAKEETKKNEGPQKGDAKRRPEELLGEISKLLQKGDAKRRPEELSGEISKLLQGKRCLVVVDDIWKVEAWERLKLAFDSIFTAASSSKILVTTRNQGLLKRVDRSRCIIHLLKPLSDDDSWELLKRKAFLGHGNSGGESSTPSGQHEIGQHEIGQHEISQNELPQDDAKVKYESDHMEELAKLGRKMLKHCKGLPIAIVALGGILSEKYTPSDWEDVEKNISSHLMDDTEECGDVGNPTLKVLELSYLDLPYYLKPCFLYLGNFPEDHQISTQRLYHLWEAEGLLTIEGEAKKRGTTSYSIGERYLNELIQRSMVQVGELWTSGRIKTCHVHDVMRDMCLIKCEEVSFLHHIKCAASSDVASTMPVLSNEIKKLRRCALYDESGDWLNTRFHNGERAIGLRSLLVFHKVGTLQKIWQAFPLLRVLDLEGTDIDSIDGVGQLIHLKYLSLRDSKVKVLPSCLYDLKYLETLDLQSWLEWEEKIKLCNEFDKMKRLRHLYLPITVEVEGDKKLTFPNGGQMETIINFDPNSCETKELMQMTNLRSFSITSWYKFEKAEELKWVLEAPVMKKVGQLINNWRLEIKGDLIKEDPSIFISTHHPCLNDLRVKGLPWLNSSTLFPDRLIELQLCDGLIGEGHLLALGKFLHLQCLTLHSINIIPGAEGENKLSFPPGSFPQLTILQLPWRPEWEEWEVGDGALPRLQHLMLHECSKLKKVKNMPNSLTRVKVLSYQSGGAGPGGLLLALEKLPHLQELDIRGDNIKLCLSPDSFLQLTQLTVDFSKSVEWEWEIGDGALPNLKSLNLFRCNKLNDLKNIPTSVTSVLTIECEIGDGLFLSTLEKLPHLEQLEIRHALDKKLSFSPGSFPQLTQLRLRFDNKLEEWEVGDRALPNLLLLELENCRKLKKLPEGLPDSVHIECEDPCINGIENTTLAPTSKKKAE